MKEDDIRPRDLLIENSALLEEDIENILMRREGFVTIDCPACESRDYNFLFDKKGFFFVKCRYCETVFTNPRPTKKLLANYYATSKCYEHYNSCLFPATEKSRREIFKYRTLKIAEVCKKYDVPREKIIDVGAGFGTFCECISDLSIFKSVIAIEPSSSLAKTCRKKGITVVEKLVEDVFLEDVSMITCFELIEHLYCPKDFILSCTRLLANGGFLYLTTPNIKGFDMMVLGKHNDNIIAPNHLNFFNIQSCIYLLMQYGLEPVEVTTPGLLDVELVVKKVESGEFNLDDQSFLKEVICSGIEGRREVFQKFLSENLLSSHMSILAKKK